MCVREKEREREREGEKGCNEDMHWRNKRERGCSEAMRGEIRERDRERDRERGRGKREVRDINVDIIGTS